MNASSQVLWRRIPRQTSLASLVLATLVCCVAFAVARYRMSADVQRQRRHSAAVSRIKQLGGTVQQRAVNLANTEIKDSDLQVLEDLLHVRDLNLGATYISNAALPYIARLDSLRNLTLSGTQVDDRGMSWLGQLSNLKSLHLRQTGVTGESMDSTDLEWLDVSRCPISANGLTVILRLNPRHLSVSETSVNDDMLRTQDLSRLESIDLRKTKVSDAMVSKLSVETPCLRVQADLEKTVSHEARQ